MEQAERRDRAMRHSPINEGEPSLDDVCRCDSDLPDDEPFDEALEGDFEDDPCPHCGGRVMGSQPPVWMEEEEDDC